MGLFRGYVAPATRAIVAASQYNEYILQGLLFCTHRFAGFLSLTLKANGYFRSTLKRLPLGAEEDTVQSDGTGLHVRTLQRNGWKRFQWYRSWNYLHYYNRIHAVLRTLLELFSHSLAVYCVVLAQVQVAPRVLLKACRCVRAAALLCAAVSARLGPVACALWGVTGSSTRALVVLWDLASF